MVVVLGVAERVIRSTVRLDAWINTMTLDARFGTVQTPLAACQEQPVLGVINNTWVRLPALWLVGSAQVSPIFEREVTRALRDMSKVLSLLLGNLVLWAGGCWHSATG